MPKLEAFGRTSASERTLALLAVPETLDEGALVQGLPSGTFTCLLVWDSEDEPVQTVISLTKALLQAGCVYACTWGTGCERVHDVFDETLVEMEIDGEMPADDGHLVMTTWHSKESLGDALFFLLVCATPCEAYEESCATTLVITIGTSQESNELIRRALRDPEGFLERVSEFDADC